MNFMNKHKTIICYYAQLTRSICEKFSLTQMEYDILMFLHNHPQFNTAADIVKVRKATKSHVSTTLKTLENNGLVRKIQSSDNKKRIEIELLEPAKKIIQEGLNVRTEFVNNLFQGLSEEEIRMWQSIFVKVCNNAEKCLKEK